MKKVLMIALEFAPCRSAGVQRTLRFSEYLKVHGWQPFIVTATENIYDRLDNTLQVTPEVAKHVVQAKCEDASKKFALKGRYFQWMTLPDRYWPWYFDAVKQASKIVEQEKPDAIWSTYPVLTAHLIAFKLKKKYHIPWVADFRDPLQCRYDKSAQRYAWFKKWIEKKVVKHASKVVFTSGRAADLYRELYPQESPDKFVTIENGFYLPEKSLEKGDDHVVNPICKSNKFQLLYSGSLYANGRSPEPLFKALSQLKKQNIIAADNFILTFRPGKSTAFSALLTALDINDLVQFLPAISFEGSVREMQKASATVLIQDEIFHRQIPGKLYDYICVKKPILALTPANSATADVIKKIAFGVTANSEKEIVEALLYLIQTDIDCSEDICQYSRESKTAELAQLFKGLSSNQ